MRIMLSADSSQMGYMVTAPLKPGRTTTKTWHDYHQSSYRCSCSTPFRLWLDRRHRINCANATCALGIPLSCSPTGRAGACTERVHQQVCSASRDAHLGWLSVPTWTCLSREQLVEPASSGGLCSALASWSRIFNMAQ